jgi:hypothetical protein
MNSRRRIHPSRRNEGRLAPIQLSGSALGTGEDRANRANMRSLALMAIVEVSQRDCYSGRSRLEFFAATNEAGKQ